MFEFIPETEENYDPGESPARKFRMRDQTAPGAASCGAEEEDVGVDRVSPSLALCLSLCRSA